VIEPVGAWRAARLLIRLRVRRLVNQLQSIIRFRMGSTARKATSRTSPIVWLLGPLVGIAMLGSFTSMAYQAVDNIQHTLGSTQVRNDDRAARAGKRDSTSERSGSRPSLRRLPPAPGSVLAVGVQQGVTLGATLLLFGALLMTLASRDLARPEWDLEWLATLPLPLSTLIVSRVIEKAVTNSIGFVSLAPLFSVLAWTCGYRWTAPLLGIGLTVPMMVLIATAQVVVDTGLRLSVSPPKLRNLQAAISVISMLPLFLAMSMAMPGGSFVIGWATATPAAINWLPAGLAVRALAGADVGSAAAWAALLIVETLLLVAIGLALLRRQIRSGIVAAGIREAVPRLPHRLAPAARGLRIDALARLSPVQRRELRLLGRDRNFLVQTILLPGLIVGMQAYVAGQGLFIEAGTHPSILALLAFSLAAYSLMFSAFQTLNPEGQALWILYCVPHSLESILWQKTRLWATVTAIYPLGMFAAAIATTGKVSLPLLGAAIVVLLGVPIFAVIATALGVFGCDPLAREVQRRVRITYLYLYMLIASFYAYAIYADSIWQQAAVIILAALVAIALWQKARERLDYLLDPSAAPPSRVSVSDGLIAALLFFVLQALAVTIQMWFSTVKTLTGQMLWIAFCIAGAETYGIMRLVYWYAGTAGVPKMLDQGVARALLQGAIGGVATAFVGLAYLHIVQSVDLFPALRQSSELADPMLPLWLAALAILAAPLFEEFIFRGLIFGGLRRMFGLGTAAFASAAIFAIVHPPASVIPVFIMGVCTALVYERAKMLAAPMMLHSVYNAMILVFQRSALWWQ
jgi:ABC-2 type transport system permease protein